MNSVRSKQKISAMTPMPTLPQPNFASRKFSLNELALSSTNHQLNSMSKNMTPMAKNISIFYYVKIRDR